MDGAARRIIQRDIPLRRATIDDAARTVPDPMQIRFGSGECRIPASEVVEKRGFAEWIPAIRAIRTAPDGSVWVNRYPHMDEKTLIHVISADGEYLGTLGPDTAFPSAFAPNGDILRVERDELDVERVIVYRAIRS